jgi:hypothetical protein
LGIILILSSQSISALQFIVEEKILNRYQIDPLECAGWEGIFGIMFSIIINFILFWIPGKDYG